MGLAFVWLTLGPGSMKTLPWLVLGGWPSRTQNRVGCAGRSSNKLTVFMVNITWVVARPFGS